MELKNILPFWKNKEKLVSKQCVCCNKMGIASNMTPIIVVGENHVQFICGKCEGKGEQYGLHENDIIRPPI